MFPSGGDGCYQHSSSAIQHHPAPHGHQISPQDRQSSREYQETVQYRHRSFRPAYQHQRSEPAREDPHSPPVRDVASLKGVRYGPGHEKYPSWPTSSAAEAPAATRSPPTGGSHRSKSWTDHTHYPKETLVAYTRPFMKRNHHPQQLKPVFETSDKNATDPFRGRHEASEEEKLYEGEGSRFEMEGKRFEAEREESFAEREYHLASPPERDVPISHSLDMSTAFQVKTVIQEEAKIQYSKSYQGGKEPKKLTQAELEEYTRNYEEALSVQHQKQSSYAQSEGYHSYVSSTDSTSTPFLDRLRREVDASVSRSDSGLSSAVGGAGWDVARGDRDSVVTTSSGSASSSETLKWHGSLSDISVASSSFSATSKQLIAHSAKVKTPQRHESESVLYIARPSDSEIEHRPVPPGNCQQHRKLFPISTYSVPETNEQNRQPSNNRMSTNYSPPQMSVAERVSELERQNKYVSFQDTKRSARVGDPVLKEKQKKALLSFYERQQQKEQFWRSEPQLASGQLPPQNQPQPRPISTSRRASSASDYADWREKEMNPLPDTRPENVSTQEQPKLPLTLHVPNSARFSPNSVLDGPVIVGNAISLDDWVPERPPKNAKLLRNVYPDLYHQDERLPSPDLPLPSPPTVLEDEVFNSDEPFPPPPAEISGDYKQEIPERLICESKLIPRNQSVENVVRPLPIRSMSKLSESSLENKVSVQKAVPTREHAHSVVRPANLPINSANVLPYSQNPYKRAYSNFSDKQLRNSFRSPHENQGLQHIDFRASMRQCRNNVGMQNKVMSPQKPMHLPQKILVRSVTIDESLSTPKRPINPFLRSTSLRQSESENHKIITSPSSLPQTPLNQKLRCDRAHMRYSCGPIGFNGNLNEKPEGVGHYRPELDKSKSVVSKIEQLQQILRPTERPGDVKRADMPVITPAGTQQLQSKKQVTQEPPPLYPKQMTAIPGISSKQLPEGLMPNRGEESVCYAPSRASLPEPAAGSYKLIQNKDELCPRPPLPARPALPDLLSDTARRPYPRLDSPPEPSAYDYSHRRQIDKPLNFPLEYSKPLDVETVATQKENGDEICDKSDKSDETHLEESRVEDKPTDDVVPVNEAEVAADTVADPAANTEPIKEDIQKSEAERSEADEIPNLPVDTTWADPLPAELELTLARRRLLRTLPPDNRLLLHVSLSEEAKSPIEFIWDYFGEDNTLTSTGEQKRIQPAQTESENHDEIASPKTEAESHSESSLEQLKMGVLVCSERLVTALTAAIEETAAATTANDELAGTLRDLLPAALAPKFTSHLTEVGNIAALMAALSARLARAHDEMVTRRGDDKKMAELRAKQSKLEEQLLEARALKANIDARAATLASTVFRALDAQAFRRYLMYIATKPRLVIRSRHLQHRLEHESQRLKALKQALNDR